MSIHLEFRCGGCPAVAWGTGYMRSEFRSVSGRSHGFGRQVWVTTVESLTPTGWIAADPYTGCTYCQECWESIEEGADMAVEEADA